MSLFCKHKWETIVDKVTESPYETVIKCGTMPKEVDYTMFLKKSIIILKCVKCGKLDKTITVLNHPIK